MQCYRIVNGIKNKNIKNSLGAKWNASHLAVRLCALRHWKRVSMPPTTQSLRHPLTRAHHIAPRIKTARRFTAKNPWWQNDFLEWGRIKSPKTILHGRDAILRVRDKLLIFNMVPLLWADVKYYVHTGLFFMFLFQYPQYLPMNLLMDLIGCRKFTHEIIRENLC